MSEESSECKIEVKIGEDGKPRFNVQGDCLKVEQILKREKKEIRAEIDRMLKVGWQNFSKEEQADIGSRRVMVEGALDLVREKTQQYNIHGDPINALAHSFDEFVEKWQETFGKVLPEKSTLREFYDDFLHNENISVEDYLKEIVKKPNGIKEEELEM